jgi:hypothetical protein
MKGCVVWIRVEQLAFAVAEGARRGSRRPPAAVTMAFTASFDVNEPARKGKGMASEWPSRRIEGRSVGIPRVVVTEIKEL